MYLLWTVYTTVYRAKRRKSVNALPSDDRIGSTKRKLLMPSYTRSSGIEIYGGKRAKGKGWRLVGGGGGGGKWMGA